MVKYHIVPRSAFGIEDAEEALTAEYSRRSITTVVYSDRVSGPYISVSVGRAFRFSAQVGSRLEPLLEIHNAAGTLTVRDRRFKDSRRKIVNPYDCREVKLDKIHIDGKTSGQIYLPHIEDASYKREGPRLDLFEFDLILARARLLELRRWKDPSYRRQIRQRYIRLGQYGTPHRLKQLNISNVGLERKIGELERRCEDLERMPQNTFISSAVGIIRRQILGLGDELGLFDGIDDVFYGPRVAQTRTVDARKGRKKVVHDDYVLQVADDVHGTLTTIIDFVYERLTDDLVNQALRYWELVDAWDDSKGVVRALGDADTIKVR